LEAVANRRVRGLKCLSAILLETLPVLERVERAERAGAGAGVEEREREEDLKEKEDLLDLLSSPSYIDI
jgi:hypothetical protein